MAEANEVMKESNHILDNGARSTSMCNGSAVGIVSSRASVDPSTPTATSLTTVVPIRIFIPDINYRVYMPASVSCVVVQAVTLTTAAVLVHRSHILRWNKCCRNKNIGYDTHLIIYYTILCLELVGKNNIA